MHMTLRMPSIGPLSQISKDVDERTSQNDWISPSMVLQNTKRHFDRADSPKLGLLQFHVEENKAASQGFQ